jgi:hypothetical protein
LQRVGNALENLGDLGGALESYRQELRIFEELSTNDPMIAASNRTALAERRGSRVSAEALYHQSADIWDDMRRTAR